jgi:hypothetical protein
VVSQALGGMLEVLSLNTRQIAPPGPLSYATSSRTAHWV